MKQIKSTGSPPYEDRAMKAAMQAFVTDILPYLGIRDSLQVMIPTESVILEMKVTYGDFNFKNGRGVIVHLEFQSSNEGVKGLRKYRLREAVLGDQHEADVVTYVIYSGNVKHPTTQLPGEENTYSVRTVMLKEDNADEVFWELQRKLKDGNKVEREDILKMLLTPLMGGEMEQYKRMETGFRLIKQCEEFLEDSYEKEKFQAVLYAFALKFLDHTELEKLKEEIGMSYLGELLTQDALDRGREEGRKEGRKESMLCLLETGMSPEEIARLLKVNVEEVKSVQILI